MSSAAVPAPVEDWAGGDVTSMAAHLEEALEEVDRLGQRLMQLRASLAIGLHVQRLAEDPEITEAEFDPTAERLDVEDVIAEARRRYARSGG